MDQLLSANSSMFDILNSDPDYLQDLIVRSTYHSASIEGNTITIDETLSILKDGIIPNFQRAMSLRELHEITNLGSCWGFLLSCESKDLNISLMHQLHSLVMNKIDSDCGTFKVTQNMVGGKLTTSPEKVSTEIMYLIDQLNNGWIAYATSDEDKVRAAVEFHMQYEYIHPYSDGNGRTGRLLTNLILMKQNLPPFVIKQEDRARYYSYLRESNVSGFLAYALEAMDIEKKLINRNGKLV